MLKRARHAPFWAILLVVSISAGASAQRAEQLPRTPPNLASNSLVRLTLEILSGKISREDAIRNLRRPDRSVASDSTVRYAMRLAMTWREAKPPALDAAEILQDVVCETVVLDGHKELVGRAYTVYALIATEQRSWTAGRKARARLESFIASDEFKTLVADLKEIVQKLFDGLGKQLASDPLNYDSVIEQANAVLGSGRASAPEKADAAYRLCEALVRRRDAFGATNIGMIKERCASARALFSPKNDARRYTAISLLEFMLHSQATPVDWPSAIAALTRAIEAYKSTKDAITLTMMYVQLGDACLAAFTATKEPRERERFAKSAAESFNSALEFLPAGTNEIERSTIFLGKARALLARVAIGQTEWRPQALADLAAAIEASKTDRDISAGAQANLHLGQELRSSDPRKAMAAYTAAKMMFANLASGAEGNEAVRLQLTVRAITNELGALNVASGQPAEALAVVDSGRASTLANALVDAAVSCPAALAACSDYKQALSRLRAANARVRPQDANSLQDRFGLNATLSFDDPPNVQARIQREYAAARTALLRSIPNVFLKAEPLDVQGLRDLASQNQETAFASVVIGRQSYVTILSNQFAGAEIVKVVDLDGGHPGSFQQRMRELTVTIPELFSDLAYKRWTFLETRNAKPLVDEDHDGTMEILNYFRTLTAPGAPRLGWFDATILWRWSNLLSPQRPRGRVDARQWSQAVMEFQHRALLSFQQTLVDTIDEMDQRLGSKIVAALSGTGVKRIVVVPPPELASMPLSAMQSWRAYQVSSTTSLLLFKLHRLGAADHRRVEARVVTNPTKDLACSEVAARSSMAADGRTSLVGEAATAEAILSLLGRPPSALPVEWHISTHASYDLADPLYSGLRASDRPITFAELLALPISGVQLAVLSACETSLSRAIEGNDQLVSLPAILGAAGVPSVVGSLWRVDEVASALLISKFNEERREGKTTVAALQRAQDWIRTVSRAQALGAIRALASLQNDQQARRCEMLAEPLAGNVEAAVGPPFADPFYWAGFVVVE